MKLCFIGHHNYQTVKKKICKGTSFDIVRWKEQTVPCVLVLQMCSHCHKKKAYMTDGDTSSDMDIEFAETALGITSADYLHELLQKY